MLTSSQQENRDREVVTGKAQEASPSHGSGDVTNLPSKRPLAAEPELGDANAQERLRQDDEDRYAKKIKSTDEKIKADRLAEDRIEKAREEEEGERQEQEAKKAEERKKDIEALEARNRDAEAHLTNLQHELDILKGLAETLKLGDDMYSNAATKEELEEMKAELSITQYSKRMLKDQLKTKKVGNGFLESLRK